MNDATCRITDRVSSTKTPPMIDEHDLLADDHGDDAERGAERERADVAHEHLRRVGVEPEEAEAGADERAQKISSSPAPGTYGICR